MLACDVSSTIWSSCTKIVRLLDYFSDDLKTTLVLEYMPLNLWDVLSDCKKLSDANIKYCLQKVLLAVEKCHQSGIIHRDIKASNVLLDTAGHVVLSDFGIAIPSEQALQDTYVPGTRWFRAPEFMVGSRLETTKGDCWSVGCFFAQMLNEGTPIYRGSSDIDHLCQVFKVLGGPSEKNWPSFQTMPIADKLAFSEEEGTGLRSVLPDCSDKALSLLQKFLQLEPTRRISASEALQDEFFRSLPSPEPLRDFTNRE
mmetsp:Transcript_12010/g.36613  ORF Transcript_12010/g.36613 Transcript_12010/m.36613 type:complete len:256 (+) Transcript_12010:389-1156(+)